MLKISKNNNEIFEVSSEILGFKFFKSKKNKGKYEIFFKNQVGTELFLKECFSCINFQSVEPEKIIECASVEYDFENKIEKIEDEIGRGLRVIFIPINGAINQPFFKILFKIYDNYDFLLIKLVDIKDQTEQSLPVHSISPLTIKNSNIWLSGTSAPTNLNNISFFKNGFQSWSPSKILFGKEKDVKGHSLEIFNLVYDNQDYIIEGRFYSEYCSVITELSSKNSLILGFTTLKDQFSRIILDYNDINTIKLLAAIGCMDGVKFKETSISTSEELFVCFKPKNLGYYGLIDYAKVVKTRNNRKNVMDIPTGWCSWYYYFTEITQEEMINNLDFFKTHGEVLPIDFIQLDDGYFTKIGDYTEANSKFSKGLGWLFDNIKASGFKGGLWTAPFFAIRQSNLFKNHQNWFLKKSNKVLKTNFNWNAFQYSLDLSNNEVLEYLRDLFNRFLHALKENNYVNNVNEIEFFKIDFLHAAVPYEADYSDKALTRAQLFYNGVKAIRSGITDKSYLLGCGAPLGPCVGLVDAMRISCDTAPNWDNPEDKRKREVSPPSLKYALLNTLYRSFMHRNFWINDPDCLMIRHSDTNLNLTEIQLQLTIFGLSGGQILISDNMSKLSENEINDAKLVVPPYNPKNYSPILVDAFTSELPSVYALETNEIIGKRFLVSIINWGENSTTKSISISEIVPNLSIDENKFYIFDFWNKRLLGEFSKNDRIDLKDIKPHSCQYLSIISLRNRLKEIPILISTNLHISQGCREINKFEYDTNKNKLFIDIDLIGARKGSLYLKLPLNKTIANFNFEFSKIDDKNNLWELFVEFKDKISLEIHLG